MSVTPLVLIGAISIALLLTGLFIANLCLTMMIGDINRKSANEDALSYFGFTLSKIRRVFSDYRRLYPAGNYGRYAIVGIVMTVAGLAGITVSLQLGGY